MARNSKYGEYKISEYIGNIIDALLKVDNIEELLLLEEVIKSRKTALEAFRKFKTSSTK